METANPPRLTIETLSASMSSIIPSGFNKALGAYDPGLALAAHPTLAYDHYFVSWDMGTQWIAGVNQHQALLQDLAASRTRNRQPIVTLEPWSVAGLSASNLLQDVLAGKYDANIQWACADLATYGGTVVVRWGHEMENLTGRYPWATSSTSAYVSAYRYFVDKCRGLAPNTRYMWSPTGNRNLGGYWPGPAYADYVGVSVYDYPDWEVSYYGYNRSFHENFSERYNYVVGYGKPIFIAEFGATGATQLQWLADALADMANFPQLQAANFFDAKDPAGWGALPAPDWRIDPALLSPPI
jgi:cellulose synthase (UDP-forming)